MMIKNTFLIALSVTLCLGLSVANGICIELNFHGV